MVTSIDRLRKVLGKNLEPVYASLAPQVSKLFFFSCTIKPTMRDGNVVFPGQCFDAVDASFCNQIGGVLGKTSKCENDVLGVSDTVDENSATAADDNACLRFPQPWPWVGAELGKPLFDNDGNPLVSIGGGNTCGDPYLGWHPEVKTLLRPFSERMNETLKPRRFKDGREGYLLCGGQPWIPPWNTPAPPKPLILIYADTRQLSMCDSPPNGGQYGGLDTPYSGCHVRPGPKGPPLDGGVWRGFSERSMVINPKFVEWAAEHKPECLEEFFCNVTPSNMDQALGGTFARIASICWARSSPYIGEDCPIKTLPFFPGTSMACEEELCKDINAAYEAIKNNSPVPIAGQGEPSWSKVPWDPRRACEKLTGLSKNGPTTASIIKAVEGDGPPGGGLSAWDIRNKPKLGCGFQPGIGPAGAMGSHFKSKAGVGMQPTDPCYKTWTALVRANTIGGFQPSNPDCFNCMVYLNPNTLGFGSNDHPMPKTPEQIRQIMERLAALGCPIDWIPRQGCGFEVYA